MFYFCHLQILCTTLYLADSYSTMDQNEDVDIYSSLHWTTILVNNFNRCKRYDHLKWLYLTFIYVLKFWYIMHIRDDICQIYLKKLPERVWEIC
jgi:hypothetical protein